MIYVEGGNSYHIARSLVDADLVDDMREADDQTSYVGATQNQ